MSHWEKIGSRKIAESTMFTLTEDDLVLPDGSEKTYTKLALPDFAGVLPVFENELILVKNYRYPVDRKILELPAGFIDEGERPREAAERELEEETGFLLKDCQKLCEYHPIASLNDQIAHLFVGKAEKGGVINHDIGEDIEINPLPIDKAYSMLEDNEITHPHTAIAMYRAEKIIEDLEL